MATQRLVAAGDATLTCAAGPQGTKVQRYSRKKVEVGLGEDWQIGEVM